MWRACRGDCDWNERKKRRDFVALNTLWVSATVCVCVGMPVFVLLLEYKAICIKNTLQFITFFASFTLWSMMSLFICVGSLNRSTYHVQK